MQIFYQSRTVSRLLAWSEPRVPRPLACKDHPLSFLSLDLFVVLSDRSIAWEGNAGPLATKNPPPRGAPAALDPGRSRWWLALSLTG